MEHAGYDDLLLVRASLLENEFRWNGTSSEIAAWSAQLEAYEQGAVPSPEPHRVHFSLRIHEALGVWMNVSLTLGGKHEGSTSITLTGISPNVPITAWNAMIDKRLAEVVPNPVFDTFTELQQLAASLDEVQTVQSPVQSPVPPLPSDPQIVLMKRVIFWSHHLVAPSKRKQFAAWCPELHVWGLVKLGYPGFLCFEGEHGDVENMIQRVKRMQWHALSMRVEVDWSYAHIDTDSHNICTQALQHCLLKQDGKARTACEEINDMGAFIARCV